MIDLGEVRITIDTETYGPACMHNLICWLCDKNSAVYNMNPHWRFEPCWECQKRIKPKTAWQRFKELWEEIKYGH